jgi:hypothetical protein
MFSSRFYFKPEGDMSNIGQEITEMCNYAKKHKEHAAIILTSRLIAEIVQEGGLPCDLSAKRINNLRWFETRKNVLIVTCEGVITPREFKGLVDMAEDITSRLNLQ